MENKILIASMLLFLSVGWVGASTIASSNAGCTAGQEEFSLTENVYANVTSTSEAKVSIWVCPCGWTTNDNVNNYPGCTKKVNHIGFNQGQTICVDIGSASSMPDAEPCKCYDIFFDSNENGIFDADDAADEIGVFNCSDLNHCHPTAGEAGFHIYPEASTIILSLSGLVLLFGYMRVRKRK